MHWKQAPDVAQLAKVAPLFQILVNIAPHGVLPGKKFRQAISKCDERSNIIFANMDFVCFCDSLDTAVRIAFSKFRDLATNPLTKDRCTKKALLKHTSVVLNLPR